MVSEEESGARRGKAGLTGKEQENPGDPANALGAGYIWKFMQHTKVYALPLEMFCSINIIAKIQY